MKNKNPFRPECIPDRPSGRPAGSINNKTLFRKVALQPHQVKENGETKTYNTIELLAHILKQKARRGDLRALNIFDLNFGIYLDPPAQVGGTGVMLAPERLSDERWIRQQEERHALEDALIREIELEIAMEMNLKKQQ